jgi:hypothetical protein
VPDTIVKRPQTEDEIIQQALARLRAKHKPSMEMLIDLEWELTSVFQRAQHLQRLEFYQAEAAARGIMDLHG